TEPVGSQVYQRSENPSHWVSERPLLKEKRTAVTTGIAIQITYAKPTTHMNRVSAQGLVIHSLKLCRGRGAPRPAVLLMRGSPGRPGSCSTGSRGWRGSGARAARAPTRPPAAGTTVC